MSRARRVATMVAISVFAGATASGVLIALDPSTPSSAEGTSATPEPVAPLPPPEDITVAIVGDSLTAGIGKAWPGDWDADAWPMYADNSGVDIVAGYAYSGADSADILPHVTDWGTDAVVILVGTNDVRGGRVDITSTTARIEAMALSAGAREVFICALPPAGDPSAFGYLNTEYRSLAQRNNWNFIDPFLSVRDGDFYKPGASSDGVHMTAQTAATVGSEIRRHIIAQISIRHALSQNY